MLKWESFNGNWFAINGDGRVIAEINPTNSHKFPSRFVSANYGGITVTFSSVEAAKKRIENLYTGD